MLLNYNNNIDIDIHNHNLEVYINNICFNVHGLNIEKENIESDFKPWISYGFGEYTYNLDISFSTNDWDILKDISKDKFHISCIMDHYIIMNFYGSYIKSYESLDVLSPTIEISFGYSHFTREVSLPLLREYKLKQILF